MVIVAASNDLTRPAPELLQAIEQLNYRVTVGDVAARSGLDVKQAERGLMALAATVGGHLDVSPTGEIAYRFTPQLRQTLRDRFWQVRWQETWQKIWRVLFYLIRLSFGLVLILLIAAVAIAIVIILIGLSSSDNDNGGGGGSSSGGGSSGGSRGWSSPGLWNWDFSWIFYGDSYSSRPRSDTSSRDLTDHKDELGFFESIFSFLFGDGDPNRNLEEQRWQTIGRLIRSHNGSIVAEQVLPYLDAFDPRELSQGRSLSAQDAASHFAADDAILPVLVRFNGQPEVSPEGDLVYRFPELQVTAVADLDAGRLDAGRLTEASLAKTSHPTSYLSPGSQESEAGSTAIAKPYLEEALYVFSRATKGQKIAAVVLGVTLLILSLILAGLLTVATEPVFFTRLCGVALTYSVAYLTVPVVRNWVIQNRNRQIRQRNRVRLDRAKHLSRSSPDLDRKLAFAQGFGQVERLRAESATYRTDEDLAEQELKRLED